MKLTVILTSYSKCRLGLIKQSGRPDFNKNNFKPHFDKRGNQINFHMDPSRGRNMPPYKTNKPKSFQKNFKKSTVKPSSPGLLSFFIFFKACVNSLHKISPSNFSASTFDNLL